MKPQEDRHEDRDDDRIARDICDGVSVDWDAELRARGSLSARLEKLRLLERLALAHGGMEAERTTVNLAGSSVEATAAEAGDSQGPSKILFAWGHLQVLEKIGEGKFGDVYRAHDPALNTEVALKLCRTDLCSDKHETSRLLQEAHHMARIRHPNVLVVHGADVHENRVGIWTELVRGKTLERCVLEQGPFSPSEVALIGSDLCAALASLHAVGLVHRDIKPSNVMRREGGQIILMDFGSACGSTPQDEMSGIIGTPVTMAPEIILQGDPPNTRTDIYSLGSLLYWLLTQHFPVEARTLSELREQHRKGTFAPLVNWRPEIPAGFARVVERALSRDPSERYPSVGDMQQALMTSIGPLPRKAPHRMWRKTVMGVGVALLILAGAVGVRLVYGKLTGFEAQAHLYRATFAGPEPLESGSLIQSGDRFFLELMADRNFHVYVLAQDDIGKASLLFPAGTDLSNPLQGSTLQRLPGRLAGQEQTWRVTSNGSEETIVVITSRHPIDRVEDWIDEMKQIGVDSPQARADSSSSLGPPRGDYKLTPDLPESDERRALFDYVRRLQGSRGVRVFEIHLKYPDSEGES